MKFDFATAGRILFGAGAVRELGAIASDLGRTALFVAGLPRDRCTAALESLANRGLGTSFLAVEGEPDIEMVRGGVSQARADGCDVVIGHGGGSAIDAGKAISAMMTNPGELEDYLEVIGLGRAVEIPPAPFVAVPTTAGTGSEVTRNAVLAAPAHRVKVSLRSPLMIPRVALIDPELTFGLPPEVTASTGLDALTQVIEPFVSIRANPLTDGCCREGMRLAARSLRRAWHDGSDPTARADMCLASLMGGLSLANAGLGVVHGFAAPVGGMFPAPHGAACAALLPHGMRANIRALRERAPQSEPLRRYGEAARILTGRADARPEEGADWVADLCRELRIPGLARYGIGQADIPELCGKAAQASSMKANPIQLGPAELEEVLRLAL